MALSDILKFTKTLVTLADDLQNYYSEMKEIRRELRDLTIVVSGLKQEIEHSKERAAGDRKNLLLELENEILKFEKRMRQLPPKEDDEGE